MKKGMVLGLGVSGKAVARYWLRRGVAVVGVDQKAIELQGVQVEADLVSLDGVELIVVSPGIPPYHPWVQKARQSGIPVVGEAQFALSQIGNRCIGVTGSNGKTTTVRLIEHVLRAKGMKARALGNVGEALTDYLDGIDPEEILVVELSSFQLENLDVRCFEAAAILNISPNHLNRHASMEEYARIKLHIQDCLTAQGQLFVSEQVAKGYGNLLKPFVCAPQPENENIARLICFRMGISEEEFHRALATFRKPPHRIEWVAEIDGIAYYNDSKATSVEAVLYAVRRVEGPLILLMGGVDKGAPYTPWKEAFRGKVKQIIAFGQAASLIEKEMGSEFSVERVETLEEALTKAQRQAQRGDRILLSPGCASYDQFRDYEHRGEEFKRMVMTYGSKKNNPHSGTD